MTARELARLGQEMRAAQRDYFRQRNPATLALAKRHEGAFDRACKAALAGPTLFDGAPIQEAAPAMRTHDLKTWPGPFQALWEGRKTAELRIDNRTYEEGDELHLREYHPETARYSGRVVRAKVSHITRSTEFLKIGHVMLSLGDILRTTRAATQAEDSPPPVAPQDGAGTAPHPLQPLAHCLMRKWCSACRMYHQPGECLL